MATKKIRFLVDAQVEGVPYKSNDFVEMDSDLAQAQIAAGLADDSDGSMKYMKDSGAVLKKHETPKPADESAEAASAEAEAEPDSGKKKKKEKT